MLFQGCIRPYQVQEVVLYLHVRGKIKDCPSPHWNNSWFLEQQVCVPSGLPEARQASCYLLVPSKECSRHVCETRGPTDGSPTVWTDTIDCGAWGLNQTVFKSLCYNVCLGPRGPKKIVTKKQPFSEKYPNILFVISEV